MDSARGARTFSVAEVIKLIPYKGQAGQMVFSQFCIASIRDYSSL